MWSSEIKLRTLYRSCDITSEDSYYRKECNFSVISSEDFHTEVKNLKYVNKFGIGPEFYEFSVSDNKGIIKMQNLETEKYMTIENICKGEKNIFDQKVLDNFLSILLHMMTHGFMHMDLNFGNIMVNLETKQVQLIDFAHVQYFEPNISLDSQSVHTPIPYLLKKDGEKITIKEILKEALMTFTSDISDCDVNIFSTPEIRTNLSSFENIFEKLLEIQKR